MEVEDAAPQLNYFDVLGPKPKGEWPKMRGTRQNIKLITRARDKWGYQYGDPVELDFSFIERPHPVPTAKDPRTHAAQFVASQLRQRSDELFGLAYSYDKMWKDGPSVVDVAAAYRDMADEFEAWTWLTKPPNQH